MKLEPIPKFENITFVALHFRVKIKNRLDDEAKIEILSSLIEDESLGFERVGSKWRLVADIEDLENDRVVFDIDRDGEVITLAFPGDISVDQIEKYIRSMCDKISTIKKFLVAGIQWIDVMHSFEAGYWDNHHALLAKTYYSGSVLDNVIPKETTTNCNITIGGVVNGFKSRECLAVVRGIVTTSEEVISGDFDEEPIDIAFGYVETDVKKKFNANIMISLLEDAREYLVSKEIITKLVKPLDDRITEEKKE